MKILLVVEVLHDVQVGLQGLDLRGEVFGDLLHRLVAREEVEYLVDVSLKISTLPNSSISLVLNVGQSMMLLKGPRLARGMVWRVRATLKTSSARVKLKCIYNFNYLH